MSKIAIEVSNLGKKYHIGRLQSKHTSLREVIDDMVRRPFRKAAQLLKGHAYGAAGLNEEIWALKGINFDIEQGEVVGIIGKNGAGKSTLLKILSRITDPSEGRVKITGRVGSLLEVGTGFHPELTGRDNIYLNGAILGMRRLEIDRKFDEIVTFSEIGKFIDTPVKFYSSGMYVRLAFAVAAHLEPDILIVDEVLAVGDIAFQKKCMGKMENVGREGRTVILVSHNMAAITNLCQKAVLIENGGVKNYGLAQGVVEQYRNDSLSVPVSKNNSPGYWMPDIDTEKHDAYIFNIEMINRSTGKRKERLYSGDKVVFRLHYFSKIDARGASFGFGVRNMDNVQLMDYTTYNDMCETPINKMKKGHVDCIIDEFPLTAGDYVIEARISIPRCGYVFRSQNYGELEVHAPNEKGSRMYYDSRTCLVNARHQWEMPGTTMLDEIINDGT